jgi:hypothetical protein
MREGVEGGGRGGRGAGRGWRGREGGGGAGKGVEGGVLAERVVAEVQDTAGSLRDLHGMVKIDLTLPEYLRSFAQTPNRDKQLL